MKFLDGLEDFIWPTHINSKNFSAPKSKSILLGLWKQGLANFILSGIRKPVLFITLIGWRLVIELNTQNFALNWVELNLDVTAKLTLDFEKEFVPLISVKLSLPPSLFNRSSCTSSSVTKFGSDSESKSALAAIRATFYTNYIITDNLPIHAKLMIVQCSYCFALVLYLCSNQLWELP